EQSSYRRAHTPAATFSTSAMPAVFAGPSGILARYWTSSGSILGAASGCSLDSMRAAATAAAASLEAPFSASNLVLYGWYTGSIVFTQSNIARWIIAISRYTGALKLLLVTMGKAFWFQS